MDGFVALVRGALCENGLPELTCFAKRALNFQDGIALKKNGTYWLLRMAIFWPASNSNPKSGPSGTTITTARKKPSERDGYLGRI